MEHSQGAGDLRQECQWTFKGPEVSKRKHVEAHADAQARAHTYLVVAFCLRHLQVLATPLATPLQPWCSMLQVG